jgi:hypothetical protein
MSEIAALQPDERGSYMANFLDSIADQARSKRRREDALSPASEERSTRPRIAPETPPLLASPTPRLTVTPAAGRSLIDLLDQAPTNFASPQSIAQRSAMSITGRSHFLLPKSAEQHA